MAATAIPNFEEEEEQESRLQGFLLWLQANNVELRGCEIKSCDSKKGFGVFSTNHVSDDGVLLVVPLDLMIAPMRVLQDPLIGPECRAMFEEGDVDDRFLIILFLMVERLRKNSLWKPYLDMLPKTFGNTLWFSDDEFSELKGTALYRATELQKRSLMSLYDSKVKNLVKKLLALDGGSDSVQKVVKFVEPAFVRYAEFHILKAHNVWLCAERANSVFWARALNIPLPYAYVFPKIPGKEDSRTSIEESTEASTIVPHGEFAEAIDEKREIDEAGTQVDSETTTSAEQGTIWVEGLIPGIDFCNHDLKAAATWEVDRTGSPTGVPFSMYLLSAGPDLLQTDKEISISYGNKGNEELLYLYGFVIENNPDDYLMVHYPVEAIPSVPFSDSKAQLLEAQKAELRCLLPRNLLGGGFFRNGEEDDKGKQEQSCSYSWSGLRKMPSYLNKMVFPDNFLSALRTISMKEDEIFKVSSLFEELVGSGGEREPTDTEVRSAVWEACGDSGALQLLVDLLNMRVTELEEYSGTEDSDSNLLSKADIWENVVGECSGRCSMSRNKWASIVYRRGQKQLTRLFLREAEQALELALAEGN